MFICWSSIIAAAAVLGNTLNYFIGAWLGKKVYDGTIGWIDQIALMKTHAFFERHGGKTVMISRFVPVVRSFAPLVAGASGMDFHKFQFFNVLGAGVWVVSLVYGGYLFGNIPLVRDNLGIILIVGIGAVAGAADARGAAKAAAAESRQRAQVVGSGERTASERRILREVTLDARQDGARHLILIRHRRADVFLLRDC